MPEHVYRQGAWWHRRDDGTWLRWNAERSAWEETGGPSEAAGAAVPARPHLELRTPWRWVLGFLIAGLVIDLIAVASDLAEISLLARIGRGEVVDPAEAAVSDSRQGTIAVAQTAAFLVTAGLFIWWFHRAYGNLPALGAANLRYKRGWAIGAWFVPILNLFRPKQIADDIWRASDPARSAGEEWHGRRVPGLLHWWWGVFLLSGLVTNAATQLALRADTLPQLQSASNTILVSDGLSAVSVILAILVVNATTRRQERRAEILGLRASPVSAVGTESWA